MQQATAVARDGRRGHVAKRSSKLGRRIDNQMVEKGIDVRVENIFNEDWTNVKQDVIDFIQQEGVTIVLCDGGWKIGEFKIFSKLIKDGDYILAHDYSYDKVTYENEIKNKIWNWCEITESDIESSVN